MKKYQVVTDCVGMPFNKRRFYRGEIIEVADDVDPKSDCFKLLSGDVVPEKKADGITLKELTDNQVALTSAKAGMLATEEEIKPVHKARKTTRYK